MKSLVKGTTFVLMLVPIAVGSVVGLLHVGYVGGYDAVVDALDNLFD
jgi:hypothetical protein